MKKVVLVWGGWSCEAGYTHWAYVAKYVKTSIVNTVMPGCEKIGKRLHQPPNREEITNPKNCNYDKEPKPFPIPLCREWIKEKGYKVMAEIKMRTS